MDKIDYWQKWIDLIVENNDFVISEEDYKLYVLQGGSVKGNGILEKQALQDKLNGLVKKRARIFHLVQLCDLFMSEKEFKKILDSRSSIEKYAYVKHDKDTNENEEHKKEHWHIIIQTKNSTPLSLLSISSWFKIPINMIEIPKGKSAFIQSVQYLTHETQKEQDKGKHKYEDSEITANFDFRQAINDYVNSQQKKSAFDLKCEIREKVLNGLDLSEVSQTDYVKDRTELNALRKEYVSKRAKMPLLRTNIFIEGGSGFGKSISARAYANQLCGWTLTPENFDLFVFEVGSSGVELQNYSGQKIILWDDVRIASLVEKLGGITGFLNTFDPVPSRQEKNIKHGSIRLINTINIITSKETFKEFVSGFVKFETANCADADKQIRRRFPIITTIKKINYDLRWNKQYFDTDEPNYKLYYTLANAGLNIENAKLIDKKYNGEVGNKHFLKLNKKFETAQTLYVSEDTNDENEEDMNQLLLDFNENQEPELFVEEEKLEENFDNWGRRITNKTPQPF